MSLNGAEAARDIFTALLIVALAFAAVHIRQCNETKFFYKDQQHEREVSK